jgi:probable HAF family extracellular repeat protein
MNSRVLKCMTAVMLFAVLALPAQLGAQSTRYKLIDLGTFGGPNSYFFSEPVVASVNNGGTVVGGADTGLPDPTCFVVDCNILHAFEWKKGVLTDLGTLPGGANSMAFWVNDQGLVMGASENGVIDPVFGAPQQFAVLWKDGQITNLGSLGGGISFANAMNNRGEAVGIAANAIPDPSSFLGVGTQIHAFLWREGVMLDLGTLGGPDSWAASVNERGQVAGWALVDSTVNSALHPFLWQDGRMIDLGTLGGTVGVTGSFTAAGGVAINSRGQVVGTSNLAGDLTHHPFLWNQGSLADLGTLGGDNGEANFINDAGVVVGWADVPGSQSHHAFRWEKGVMTDLGVPAGQSCSRAIAVNARGQIIILTGICGVGGGPGALWENGVMHDLNTLIPPGSGFFIGDVNFINDSGEIAATGILPNGDQHALLLIPAGKDDDNANSAAVATQAVPAAIKAVSGAPSRYGRFGRRTSAPK